VVAVPPSAPVARPKAKPREGSLTPEEIDVLRRSSVINGRTFMPWLPGEEAQVCGVNVRMSQCSSSQAAHVGPRFMIDPQEKFNYEDRRFKDPEGLLPLSAKQASKLVSRLMRVLRRSVRDGATQCPVPGGVETASRLHRVGAKDDQDRLALHHRTGGSAGWCRDSPRQP
jgi:hypothetical protein